MYVWDLEEKRIHVLDPVLCRETRNSQAATHSVIVASLHEKLFEWLEEVLSGWVDDTSKYKIAFYNFTHQPATRYVSPSTIPGKKNLPYSLTWSN